MLESIRFSNFKMLRDATLPLGRFTLIVGPNGSGKSTAMVALRLVASSSLDFQRFLTHGLQSDDATIEIEWHWSDLHWNEPPYDDVFMQVRWNNKGNRSLDLRSSEEVRVAQFAYKVKDAREVQFANDVTNSLRNKLAQSRVYSLDAHAIAAAVQLQPRMELQENGGHLAGVLDQLRDRDPERFEALNDELGRWLPEFDRILFETPSTGTKSFLLRTRQGRYAIQAQDLSQGTLLALAILTLAYLLEPPPIVCFEEPDRGMHPRLLRDIQDALYRLSYPENFGETRPPVQVVATTHSPYFLDLFRDHPEEIVIAQKVGQEGQFERLSDRPDIDEILGDAPLGEVWYSGVLGGVPTER